MTFEDFKKLGVDGVYRPDLDEWFPVGQEPPKAKPMPVQPIVDESATTNTDEVINPLDKPKADKKTGVKHG